MTLLILCSAYTPLLGDQYPYRKAFNSSLPSAPPSICPTEGGRIAEGRVLPISLKMGYDLPLHAPTGDSVVVHEVGPSQSPGRHSFVGWGAGGYPVGKGECGSPILEGGQEMGKNSLVPRSPSFPLCRCYG
jgi:hypothetical protein